MGTQDATPVQLKPNSNRNPAKQLPMSYAPRSSSIAPRSRLLGFALLGLAYFALLFMPGISDLREGRASEITVGSKAFTESVILGEVLRLQSDNVGVLCKHRKELSGTQVLWNALKKGEIDAYVEYSGTIQEEILKNQDVNSLQSMVGRLLQDGITMSAPLGFNNTYALGMRSEQAEKLGIQSIADLTEHSDLRFGFSDEFAQRPDGWKGLKNRYGLNPASVQTLDHSLSYRGVFEGAIDVIDLYSTDAEIAAYDLRILDDRRDYFPRYEAVVLYRTELKEKHPAVAEAFEELAGKINENQMTAMNKSVRIDKASEAKVALQFLKDNDQPDAVDRNKEKSVYQEVFIRSIEHQRLVVFSLAFAIIFAIPLGIAAYKAPRLGEAILSLVGVIQTIPSLALMVFLITLANMELGPQPAIVALFLYSLLPIVRGTHTGLTGIAPGIHESAMALGLSGWAKLRLIELPLASQAILSGIKTAAVINVGTATIGALIGAGGYGQPILTGIRLDDMRLILQGAVPAAAMALLVQWGFSWSERFFVPAGLKASPVES